MIRLLDVSANQDPQRMAYPIWAAMGFAGAWRRIAVGLRLDPTAAEHRRLQRAAGLLTGGYTALYEGASMSAQCQLFLDQLLTTDELPALADVERTGLSAAQIGEWFDHWEAHSGGRELWVYTGKGVWERLIPPQLRARYARYGLMLAAYPYDAPAGTPQPMDAAAVALRSNPPQNVALSVPDPWVQPTAHQHTGHGRLPGYSNDLDLTVYLGSAAAFQERYVQPLSKLCPHIIGGSSDAKAYVLAMRSRFIKLVDDWGAAAEYKALGATVIGRHVFDDEPQPDNPEWRDEEPAACARRLYAARYRPDVLANPAVDAWEGPNEPVCKTAAGMAWYGLFEAERVRLLRADGKGAVVGNFSVGQPEPELWPLFFPALAELYEPGRWLGLHEYSEPCRGYDTWYWGRFTRAPLEVRKLITECGSDGIPPTATCPAGAAWVEQFHGNPATYADFLVTYDAYLRLHPEVDAAFLFTSGRGWPLHNVDGAGVLPALAVRLGGTPTPPDPKEIEMTRDELEALRAHGAAVVALADKYLAPPWWETVPLPFVAVANALPLTTYVAPGGAVFDVRPGASYDLNVTERAMANGEGWLKVAPKPLWVRAQDVHLKAP